MNLFHSFGQFNVGSGDIRPFKMGSRSDLNGTELPAGLPTAAILARVIGGDVSSIFGTIQTIGFSNAESA